MGRNGGTLVGGMKALARKIFPPPLIRVPSEAERMERRRQAEISIVSRQAEGNVLLSAGKIDMTKVDLFESEER